MENQYKLDLEPVKQEKTSTSLAGQLLSQGIPNLNLVYEDETVTVIDFYYEGKHTIHTEMKVAPTKELMVHFRAISDAIDIVFSDKGVDTLYTWGEVDNKDHVKFNSFLGYLPTGFEYDIPGYGVVDEYKKDLN